ncbi:Condensin complex subunit 2 [Fasciola gigantica]|uniref:Condensin complex subunit 2 n=1 Tax=Fasciola gigantica TaxID=46835 RepID=A0A504YAG3_FASGI|nr:Condensin complex subunit 2 [Fasciola gigantica]
MILSEQQPLMDIIVPKLDSDDEDISFPRRKAKRQASPARNVGVVIEAVVLRAVWYSCCFSIRCSAGHCSMILSEQQPLMDIIVPKLDSDDEDISFPRRKAKRQASPARNVGVVIEDENNDDDERLARRKSRLLEPHPASANSPCANASTTRRREAAAPRGISQAQIGEHYGNCIRLAAENKITAKNAFNLHLIDYMSDMLKKEDYASFQIASSSLDAGAKIYAGRVDAVHQETYQVLTGLGRSDKLQPTADEDDENHGDDATEPIGSANIAKDRKKTQVHRDIIQKQLNKIRSKVLAAKADVDPLFQHQTATYNEGGTAELRLNQLCTLDEACVLILDSSTRIMHTSSKPTTNTVNVTGILDFLSPLQPKNISQLHMCSSLEDFRFTNWDKGQDWDASTTRPSELQMKSPPITDSGPVDDDDDHSHFADYPQEDNLNDATLTEEPPEITDKIAPCGSSAAAAAATSKDIVPVEKSLDDTPR